jgi:hypothetical protein
MASLSSAPSATSSATVQPTSWWLKDPLDPSRNTPVSVADWKPSRPLRAGVFDVANRADPVVVSGIARGQAAIRTLSKASRDAVVLLLESRRVLLLQDVLGRSWYVKPAGGSIDEELVRARPAGGEITPVRYAVNITVPLVEVAAP